MLPQDGKPLNGPEAMIWKSIVGFEAYPAVQWQISQELVYWRFPTVEAEADGMLRWVREHMWRQR